jgi:hypothetical protein
VCVCVCVRACTRAGVRVYVRVYVCVHMCTGACICACMCMCARARVHICARVCVCVSHCFPTSTCEPVNDFYEVWYLLMEKHHTSQVHIISTNNKVDMLKLMTWELTLAPLHL